MKLLLVTGFFTYFIQIRNCEEPGRNALDNFPLVDGHNDLLYNIRVFLNNQIENFPFDTLLKNKSDSKFNSQSCQNCHTDLPRLKQGKIGGQFWSVYVPCSSQYKDAVPQTLNQIDVLKRLINKYPNDMQYVTTSDGITEAFTNKKIASIIGLEGGHSIDYKLSILRILYEVGTRYMTLTHTCNTPWAEASPVDEKNKGKYNLTNFGKTIVREMNRLGMIVDISHVSYGVMVDVLNTTIAPVIFSHSSVYTLCQHHRNVRDDVLQHLKQNGGIIMISFYPIFLRLDSENASIQDVVDHINYVADLIGVDFLGLGSDYDGVKMVSKGLEDVSKYPDLFDLLQEQKPERWNITNLEKLAGRNLVRVFQQVEEVSRNLKNQTPFESIIPDSELAQQELVFQCLTEFDDGKSFNPSQNINVILPIIFIVLVPLF